MVSKIAAGTYLEVNTEFFGEVNFTVTGQNRLILLVYIFSVSYTISRNMLNQCLPNFGLGILKTKTIFMIMPRHFTFIFLFSYTYTVEFSRDLRKWDNVLKQ